MSDITKRNLSEDLARGVAEADALLQTHSERKVENIITVTQLALCLADNQNEMDQKEESFKTIAAVGQVKC